MNDPIDLDSIQELKDIMEDEFDVLLQTFINDFELKLLEIKKLNPEKSLGDVRELAHSMKGSSINIGAFPLSQLCKELEDQAADGKIENVLGHIETIEGKYVESKKVLLSL